MWNRRVFLFLVRRIHICCWRLIIPSTFFSRRLSVIIIIIGVGSIGVGSIGVGSIGVGSIGIIGFVVRHLMFRRRYGLSSVRVIE